MLDALLIYKHAEQHCLNLQHVCALTFHLMSVRGDEKYLLEITSAACFRMITFRKEMVLTKQNAHKGYSNTNRLIEK